MGMNSMSNKNKNTNSGISQQLQNNIGLGGNTKLLMANAVSIPKNASIESDILSQLSFAKAAHKQGQTQVAEKIYQDVLKNNPKNAQALTLFGILHFQRENIKEAQKLLNKSKKLDPHNIETWNTLGQIYQEQNNKSDAFEAFEKAISINPNDASPYVNKGNLLRSIGDFKEATANFEKALELDNSIPEAWNGLARTQSFTELPANIEVLEKVTNNPHLTSDRKKSAFFALAKIYDDVGMYDKAFTFYTKGNNQTSRKPDIQKNKKLTHDIIQVFDKQLISEKSLPENNKKTPIPIFILGMPRSGTTLIEQILATHPDVSWGGEVNYFAEVARDYSKVSADKLASFPEDVGSITKKTVKEIRNGFLAKFRKNRASNYITDKTPFNFLYIGLIAIAFPEAKIINCCRNPMDNGLSIFLTDFSDNHPFSTDLSAIGNYISDYEDLMSHWHNLNILPILDVDYEFLVENQELETRKLIEFCGLEWNDRCMSYYENNRQVSTPSDWQVRQPIYNKSINRWKNYENNLKPLRDALYKQPKDQ